MRGLYAIIDTETLRRAGLDVLRFSEAVLRARPAALQLRDKRLDSREHLRLLQALAPRCAAKSVPLFANDRADLALIAGCVGVHVGQRDLPPSAVRELASRRLHPSLAVGMSVHDEAELEVALAERPDYIALGPVFDTRSKENPEPTLGVDGLSRLAARVASVGPFPRVAIGGIDLARAHEVAPHCEMAAVIGALVDASASDPYRHAEATAVRLHAALRGETSATSAATGGQP